MSSNSAEAERRRNTRYSCEVQTTCQPPSSWAKDPWPATICNVSVGGVRLRLGRRFEKGAGLAIGLPTDDGDTTTVLARVTHVVAHEGGWLLGCTFVSELADEEVAAVLALDPNRAGRPEDESAPPTTLSVTPLSVNGVLFQARVAGEFLRWYVKRLDLSGAWPLPDGKHVSFRLGQAGQHRADLVIRRCRLINRYWIVDCGFRTLPATEVLAALAAPAVPAA